MIEICREHSKNLKRWRDGTVALRWCAAGILEAVLRARSEEPRRTVTVSHG